MAPKPFDIRCMNVRYSPNLGDGLLAECLEWALHAQGAIASSCDLAARIQYGDDMLGRGQILAVLHTLPPRLRQLAVRLPLALQVKRKWSPHYGTSLAGADGMVIGGGNLLADLDLNFPTKLALALDHAATRNLKTAIFGCGMSSGWTPEGIRRVNRALERAHPHAVYLRDARSCDLWNDLFAKVSGRTAKQVRDPGLLASLVWPADRPAADTSNATVGIGVMSHVAVRYHGNASMTETDMLGWYKDLVQNLVSRGIKVVAFTNGSPEDIQAAKALRDALTPEIATQVRFEQPKTPEQLAQLIATFRALAAFRMHAVIAAYSYGVPTLALSWDEKLKSFMTSVNQADKLVDIADINAGAASARLADMLDIKTDQGGRHDVIADALNDVAKLYISLSS